MCWHVLGNTVAYSIVGQKSTKTTNAIKLSTAGPEVLFVTGDSQEKNTYVLRKQHTNTRTDIRQTPISNITRGRTSERAKTLLHLI